MTKLQLMNSVTRTVHKVGFQLKKHSPEILIVAGVVGTVTSAVLACKATTKVSAVLEKAKEDVDGIHSVLEKPELGEIYEKDYGKKYTVEQSKKDLAVVYAQTGFKLVKLYAPSVILGALSLTAIVSSNQILRKRNVALAAAYATVDKGFKEYRGRVVERFGKELDRELLYNLKSKEIEEVIVDEEGNEKTVKTTITTIDGEQYSSFARCFDNNCPGWDRDPERTRFFLTQQQNYLNEKLKARGWMTLNEVYESLGFDITEEGATIGWVYDDKNPVGDNYIDFGMFNVYRENARDFVNGYVKYIMLDFNTDGNIFELLP